MRIASTFAALVSASALALLTGCDASPSTVQSISAPTATPVSSSTSVSASAADVVVDVPEMHCPFACWPAVEKTLAGQPGVVEVELAPQKSDSAIDNPKVYLRTTDAFDADDAMAKLAAAGFDGSKVEAAN